MIAAGTHVTPTVRLLRPLGVGGMGAVWVAEHLALQTQVVVKFMAAELARDPANVERFSREAASASQVKSPHVVQTFDHGVTEDGYPFIVMEHLEGHDVMWHLKQRGRFLPQEVATVVVQVCKALSKAHEKGIVHRDLKPENIFVLEGDELFVKLLDFGVAKAAGAASSLTGVGSIVGTPFYMSPEQIVDSSALDYRADLWSLAVVAFEMLTGRKPFDADTVGGLAVQIHAPNTPRPSQFANELPLAVDAWFVRACARNPAERFQSAKEMAQELANAVGGLSHAMLQLPARVAGAAPTQQSGGWGATPPPSQPRQAPQVPQLQATNVPLSQQRVPDAFAATAMPSDDGQLPGFPPLNPSPQASASPGFPQPQQGFPQQPQQGFAPPPQQGFPPPPPQGFPQQPQGFPQPPQAFAPPPSSDALPSFEDVPQDLPPPQGFPQPPPQGAPPGFPLPPQAQAAPSGFPPPPQGGPSGFPPPPQGGPSGFPPPPQGFPAPPANAGSFSSSSASEPEKKKSKAPLIIALLVLLLAGGGVGAYFAFFADSSSGAESAASAKDEDPKPEKKKKKPKKADDEEPEAKADKEKEPEKEPEPEAEPEKEPSKPAATATTVKPTATATGTASAAAKPSAAPSTTTTKPSASATTTTKPSAAPSTTTTTKPTAGKKNDDDIK